MHSVHHFRILPSQNSKLPQIWPLQKMTSCRAKQPSKFGSFSCWSLPMISTPSDENAINLCLDSSSMFICQSLTVMLLINVGEMPLSVWSDNSISSFSLTLLSCPLRNKEVISCIGVTHMGKTSPHRHFPLFLSGEKNAFDSLNLKRRIKQCCHLTWFSTTFSS